MKKLICAVLAIMLLVSLTACGGEKKEDAVAPDMRSVYESMKSYLPTDAMAFDADYVFNAYGVNPEDCKQQVVISYYDGAVTAEIWLIEAVSKDALKSIKALAESRMTSMCEQFQSYDPKAYELAMDAKLVTEGNCLVFIVSENVDTLWDIYCAS